MRNDLFIGQQKGKTFVQEANLTNAFYLLEHNLNAGDYHFFTEVWRSWEKQVSYRVYSTQTSHYSSILNKKGHGYGEMSKVEETLVSYLSPESSSSIKSPILPNKPVRITSALVGKAFSAAGQAAACLYTMSLLQAYQAELLTDLNEGKGISPNTVCELCRATDLSLKAAKEDG